MLLKLKTAHILIPVAGLLLAGLLLTKKAAGFLNYFIQKVGITFSGFTPVLKLDIAVQNPSNESFTVSSIVGDVLVDGGNVGSGSMFQTVTIPPNAQATLPVNIRLSPLAIVSDLVSLIQRGSGIPKTIAFNGYVNANGFVNPLNMEFKVGI